LTPNEGNSPHDDAPDKLKSASAMSYRDYSGKKMKQLKINEK